MKRSFGVVATVKWAVCGAVALASFACGYQPVTLPAGTGGASTPTWSSRAHSSYDAITPGAIYNAMYTWHLRRLPVGTDRTQAAPR